MPALVNSVHVLQQLSPKDADGQDEPSQDCPNARIKDNKCVRATKLPSQGQGREVFATISRRRAPTCSSPKDQEDIPKLADGDFAHTTTCIGGVSVSPGTGMRRRFDQAERKAGFCPKQLARNFRPLIEHCPFTTLENSPRAARLFPE